MFRDWITKLRKRKRVERERPEPEERSSGEDAIATAEDEAAEATPWGMPRVKTDELWRQGTHVDCEPPATENGASHGRRRQ